MTSLDEGRARLKRAIETRAFVRAEETPIVRSGGKHQKDSGWLFDVRAIALDPSILDDIAAQFWDTYRSRGRIQIGGIESAAIPFVTALVTLAKTHAPDAEVSGFFIRKSRKKDGLMKMVEGTLSDAPIVLVDDLVNSGKSFIRQVEVLEALGKKIAAVWVLVRFRDLAYYDYFSSRGIEVRSLFTLDDFKTSLGVENRSEKTHSEGAADTWKRVWKFSAGDPSHFHVVPKSDPVIDDERVYIGSDHGVFYALNQSDGHIAWSYRTGFHPKGKGIFSSPAVHNGIVYFGAYDGCVYALDAKTGARKWRFLEADWVGSSPALAPDLGLLFIGLEFGLWRKRGGIAALDMKTGSCVWEYRMPSFTHSTPLYLREHRQVVIGSNDGAAYLFDAKKGTLVWKFETGTPTERELDTGFSAFDIKESFAYDPKRDLIAFGNGSGLFFLVRRSSGEEVFRFQAEFGFYSTPVIHDNLVFASSLDKHLYCFDLDTLDEKWRWSAGARIFASPKMIGGSLYIGANTGRLTELDPQTGRSLSYATVTERITNRPAFNERTGRLFLPTFANEVYCLEKRK